MARQLLMVLAAVSVLTGQRASAQNAPPATPAPSAAQKQRAAQYFASGRDAYRAGQFLAAAKAFEEAHRLAPGPPTVYALAQALRRQYVLDRNPDHLERALSLFRQYVGMVKQGAFRAQAVELIERLEPQWQKIQQDRIASEPVPPPAQPTQLMITSPTGGARAAVDDGELEPVPVIREVSPGEHAVRIEAPGFEAQAATAMAVEHRLVSVRIELRAKPASLRVRAPAGARVSIDGTGVDRVAARELTLPAGPHLVSVRRSGHTPFVRQLSLERGQVVDLDVDLPITPQRRIARYTAVGAGGLAVLGVAAVGLSLRAQGKAQDIEQRVGLDSLDAQDRERHNDLVHSRDTWRTAATALLVGSAATGIAAALLYVLDDSDPGEVAAGWRVEPTAGAGGAGASLRRTF